MSNLKVNTINDASGGSNAVLYGVAAPANSMGFRNRLINGMPVVWQRGTTLNAMTPSLGVPAYTADRWFVAQLTSQSATDVTQQTGGATKYSIRVQKRSGSSGASTNLLGQVIEDLNCLDLPGSALTLSFTAKAGANYSATSNNLSVSIYTCTTANQSASSFVNGTAAGQATLYSGNVVLTTTNQRFTITTSAVASNATNVCLVFGEASSSSAAGANDWFELSDVQLEAGSVASPFERRDYGRELMMCQRYFESVRGSVRADPSGGYLGAHCCFKVTKRATPTMVFVSNGTTASIGAFESFYSADTEGVAAQWNAGGANYNYNFVVTAASEL